MPRKQSSSQVPRHEGGQLRRSAGSRGEGVLATQHALDRIKARNLLGEALHPRIEAQVRHSWNSGDFETAILKAVREIEIAVAEHLPPPRPAEQQLSGVDVINAAFGKDKPLADPAQDPGEQEGTRAFYAGFIAMFKHPGSQRHFAPDDSVQPADMIRTADLLMRILDDIVAARSHSSST